MSLTFLCVLFLVFSPLYGQGKNGLQFADELFNRLAKGSSYFIPEVIEANQNIHGKPISVSLNTDSFQDVEITKRLFTTAGAAVEVVGNDLKIEGDLNEILKVILRDSHDMYHNNGHKVSARYNYNEKG
nr:hypothetical protein [Desulfobacterales bacterium]